LLKGRIGMSTTVAKKVVAETGAKIVAKYGSKAAAKTVARTAAAPELLIADGVEIVAHAAAKGLGCETGTAKAVGKTAGFGSSIAIGAVVGGPVGAGVGAAVWGLGELIGLAFA
jgi:hypothetical protein